MYSIGAEYIDDKHFDDRYLSVRTTYLLIEKIQKHLREIYILQRLYQLKILKSFITVYTVIGRQEEFLLLFRMLTIIQIIKIIQKMELQAGIAPYLGEYNELHTWIMMKTKKETINNSWDTYPFIKIFKGDFLIEIGTKNSHWDIHYMLRF